MKCINCGNELAENALFCTKCGASQAQSTQPSNPENVIEIPQSDLSNNTNGTCIAAVIDNNTVKKVKDKKQFFKIIVPIVAAIVLIIAVLGIFSIVNYNSFRPYREMLEKLESSDFVYYREYDEISRFVFSETDAQLNSFKKLLNIRKVCEVHLAPEIYYLFDEDTVEDNEDLYDLIAEEEDEEAYSDFPGFCELVIEENGEAKIVNGDEILFNINMDNDNNILSVTYNKDEKEYKNDSQLKEKYNMAIKEYLQYLNRNYSADDLLNAAINAPLYFGSYTVDTINYFIYERVDNPEVTIEAHRWDENVYIVTVKGSCLFTMSWNQPEYREDATVIFFYHQDTNESHVAQDSDQAFEWYYYSKLYY